MLYVAMFDEIDEGTAIFKTSKTPPAGKSKFVTIESEIPNDYYLYLTGFAGRVLKKEIAMSKIFRQPKSNDPIASVAPLINSFLLFELKSQIKLILANYVKRKKRATNNGGPFNYA